jgi:general stress protein YciG
MTDERRDNEFGHGGMSEEEKQEARSRGGKNSSGSFEKGSERAREAGRKGGQSS